MRDPSRIYKFCSELATIWHDNVPDWRFGQFLVNTISEIQGKHGDIWFVEEEQMIEWFKECFEGGDKYD